MVLKLAKSPLVISIGGVGAIAIALIGLAYLHEAPTPANPDLLLNNLSVSPWQQGKDLGWQAAVAAQTAQSQSDWQQVVDLWDQAIAALESVPVGDANYAQAQAKAEEYRGNRAIAANRQATASPSAAAEPGAAPATATADLQAALAASDLAFTFTPGSAANSAVGKSADGLATVELAGDRATLFLPRTAQNTSLTMAQVVYARQFLALAAPGASAQPWLLESLRTAQSDQPQPVPADAPVTLSVGPGSLSITVVSGTVVSGTAVSGPGPQP
ncbi:MAG: hypothetical protein ACFCVB_09585 [Nodosilinea sp.]